VIACVTGEVIGSLHKFWWSSAKPYTEYTPHQAFETADLLYSMAFCWPKKYIMLTNPCLCG